MQQLKILIECPPSTDYLLHSTYQPAYMLPTTYDLRPTTCDLRPATCYRLPATCYLLPTSFCLPPTTYDLCQLWTQTNHMRGGRRPPLSQKGRPQATFEPKGQRPSKLLNTYTRGINFPLSQKPSDGAAEGTSP